MAQSFSSSTVGGSQHGMGTIEKPANSADLAINSVTPTCSGNGTHSEGYTGAFEGPEKLLEVWFAPNPQAIGRCVESFDEEGPAADSYAADDFDQWTACRTGFRRVPRAVWREMLELVHCQVLSTLSNKHVDSYLLSESSFFVYAHKLVLKTCGTTTLLYAIPRIMEIARKYINRGVYQVFYSRKNFMFPSEQEELHRSWEREVGYLDAHFPDGSAYMIGKTNRDHWHLYLCGPYAESPSVDEENDCTSASVDEFADGSGLATATNTAVGSPRLLASRCSSRSTVGSELDEGGGEAEAGLTDVTVEILMTGLDADRMRAMYIDGTKEEGGRGGKAVERATGIAAIYPESATDSFLFAPCGFSLNGLQADGYYTIHVTPEPNCSYASFESNVSADSAHNLLAASGVRSLVEKVTSVFNPEFVTVTVFKARAETGCAESEGLGIPAAASKLCNKVSEIDQPPSPLSAICGYKAVDRVLYEFDHYWLRYAYFVRS